MINSDREKKLAINKEVCNDENIKKFGFNKENLEEQKSIEVGNIFPLGSKFSDALNLKTKDENGIEQSIIMGSYGIGLGRMIGTIAEVFADEKGLVWSKEVAPFAVHLIRLGNNENTLKFADKLYADISKAGVEVLYDERDLRAGEKFADSDLIGIPLRFVVSDKTIAEGKVEVKRRTGTEAELMTLEEAMNKISE